MSEAGRAGLEPNPAANAQRRFVAPWILFGIVTAALAALCIPSRLTDEEARLLLALRGDGHLPPLAVPEPVLRGWAFLVGGMERPSRLLSLMGFAGTAGLLLAALHRRGSGAPWILLLALVASPGLTGNAVSIGSPWAASLAVATILSALLVLTRLEVRTVARCGALVALLGAAPLTPFHPSRFREGMIDLGHAFAGSNTMGIVLGSFAAAVFFGWVLHRRGGWKDALFTLLVLVAAAMATPGEDVQKPQEFLLAMAWPALALLAASGCEGRRLEVGVLILAAGTAVVVAAPHLFPHSDAAQRAADRLDWIAAQPAVSPHAWVILSGPDRHLLRWMEKTGHDTGRLSMVVADAEALAELRRRALIFKPPQIVLLAPSDAIAKALARYGPDPRLSDIPPPTRVLIFQP